jgi:hypothetical protein
MAAAAPRPADRAPGDIKTNGDIGQTEQLGRRHVDEHRTADAPHRFSTLPASIIGRP